MFKRIWAGVIIAGLACAPAFAEQVRGNAISHDAPAAQQAQRNNAAVIDKGLTSTTITVPASATPQEFHVDIKPLIDGLLPYIISTMGGIIVILGGLATAWLKQHFNIEIQSKDRDAFQSAATNAAGALIARGAVSMEQAAGKISINSAAMAQVIDTVSQRVPDAINRLGVTPDQIQSLIIAKVPQVLGAGSASPIAKV